LILSQKKTASNNLPSYRKNKICQPAQDERTVQPSNKKVPIKNESSWRRGSWMLKQILNKFLILNDVQAAIVIQENGEIIQSIKSGIRINGELEAALSILMLDSKKTAAQFGNASLSTVFLEFSDNFLILGPVVDEFYLLIIAKQTANIGQITYEMKKNQDAIVSLL
jgi:predicted regulator of Ras-like GTPase activity (Roadblock/LC7/MglB family)